MRRRLRLPFLVVLSLAAGGCEDTPTSPTDASALPPYTVVFESTITPLGTASRTFTASGPGTVTATLTSTTPSGIAMTIGMGIPTSTAGGCSLNRSVTAQPGVGPELQVDVESGSYCVQVIELGQVTQPAAFSLTLVHP